MILVECYNDETVLRALGCNRRDIRRMRGKSNVIGHLKKDAHRIDAGMVDRDLSSPNPASLEPFVRMESAHDLELFMWNEQRLVVVHDNIEDWIVKSLQASGLHISDFTPARNAVELNRLEARVCEPGLERALKALTGKQSPHLATLRRFLALEA